MIKTAEEFWRSQAGQDLTEYALLLAMLSLITLGLVLNFAPQLAGPWAVAKAALTASNQAAASGQ